MHSNMTIKKYLLAVASLLLLSSSTTTTSFASAFAATTTLTDYIRTSCNSTSYPALCFTTLLPYASSVQCNPIQLALVATNLSLSSVKSAAKTAATLYGKSLTTSATAPATKALKDCKELLGDAADNTKYSLSQLKLLLFLKGGYNAQAQAQQRLWILSNAETYMSATLTNEDTCTDSLKEMGAVVNAVSSKVGNAKKYTSNALGLVNSLGYVV